jgi:hypothetical protein
MRQYPVDNLFLSCEETIMLIRKNAKMNTIIKLNMLEKAPISLHLLQDPSIDLK